MDKADKIGWRTPLGSVPVEVLALRLHRAAVNGARRVRTSIGWGPKGRRRNPEPGGETQRQRTHGNHGQRSTPSTFTSSLRSMLLHSAFTGAALGAIIPECEAAQAKGVGRPRAAQKYRAMP